MISGLVVHLSSDTAEADAALSDIRRHSQLEPGPLTEQRLPLVLETHSSDQSQAVTDWLYELPGVAHVDVTFVHLEETPQRI